MRWGPEKAPGPGWEGGSDPPQTRVQTQGSCRSGRGLGSRAIVQSVGSGAGPLGSESGLHCTLFVGMGPCDLIFAPHVFPIKCIPKRIQFFRATIGEAPRLSWHQYAMRISDVSFI